MAARNGRRRTRSGRVLDAALWGAAAGAAGGAALGAAIDSVGAALGAAIGAVVYAPAEGLTTLRRVAGAVTLVYRLVAAAVYRDRPLVAIMAEEVPASELRYVVPFEARSRYVVAEPLGQAAIPSNIQEAQRGMVSTIDTIDLDGDEEIDTRGWTRPSANSGKPIYVGIYTSFRHDDRGTSASASRSPTPTSPPRCCRATS